MFARMSRALNFAWGIAFSYVRGLVRGGVA